MPTFMVVGSRLASPVLPQPRKEKSLGGNVVESLALFSQFFWCVFLHFDSTPISIAFAITRAAPKPSLRLGENLPDRVPDALQEAVPLGEAVDGVVALALGTDKAGQRVDVVLARNRAAVLVDL